jgi:ribosomal protein S28E/S33
MKDKLQSWLWVLAIGMILGGLASEYGPVVWRLLPIGDAEVKVAAIIGESGGQTKLTKEQLHVMMVAPDYGVKVIDRDVLGPDRKPPAELVPLLETVKGEIDYKLVILRKNGGVEVYPLPETPAKLKELMQ